MEASRRNRLLAELSERLRDWALVAPITPVGSLVVRFHEADRLACEVDLPQAIYILSSEFSDLEPVLRLELGTRR